jgi:hypothetical protein
MRHGEGAHKESNPVVLPPGRAMLAAKPLPTGSDTPTNTIGMVPVSRSSAAVAGVELPTSTSGCKAINSLAKTCALIGATRREAIVNTDAAALLPPVAIKCLPECGEASLYLRVVLGVTNEHPDSTGRLLRMRRQRPRHRAAEQRDELAPPHSITSSARASTVVGRSRPSALAVLRLIDSSYLVGACTGKSAGFSPLRMRST